MIPDVSQKKVAKMTKKSVITEAQEIQLAIELVKLGARLQLLESETSLSRERLLKLYKELKGDRKSTRLNSSHIQKSRMPSSA